MYKLCQLPSQLGNLKTLTSYRDKLQCMLLTLVCQHQHHSSHFVYMLRASSNLSVIAWHVYFLCTNNVFILFECYHCQRVSSQPHIISGISANGGALASMCFLSVPNYISSFWCLQWHQCLSLAYFPLNPHYVQQLRYHQRVSVVTRA